MSRTLGLFALALFRIFDAWAAQRLGAPSVADLRYTPAAALPPPMPIEPRGDCAVCARYWSDLAETPGATFIYFRRPVALQ